MAQSVEHVLGKDEVTGSIPVNSSRRHLRKQVPFLLPAAGMLPLPKPRRGLYKNKTPVPRNEGFFFVLIDDKRHHQQHC